MQIGSNCASKCDTCYISFVGGCIAGHGDDDYSPMTKEKAEEALKNRFVREYRKKKLYEMYPDLRPEIPKFATGGIVEPPCPCCGKRKPPC